MNEEEELGEKVRTEHVHYAGWGGNGKIVSNLEVGYCPKCDREKLFLYREPVFINGEYMYDRYDCEVCGSSLALNKTDAFYKLISDDTHLGEVIDEEE